LQSLAPTAQLLLRRLQFTLSADDCYRSAHQLLSDPLRDHWRPTVAGVAEHTDEPAFDFDATRLLLADDARRYTQATMSYVSVVGLTTTIDQLLTLGVKKLEHHATRLEGC